MFLAAELAKILFAADPKAQALEFRKSRIAVEATRDELWNEAAALIKRPLGDEEALARLTFIGKEVIVLTGRLRDIEDTFLLACETIIAHEAAGDSSDVAH
jgi:hypothetical protein